MAGQSRMLRRSASILLRKAVTVWTDLRYGGLLYGNVKSNYADFGAVNTKNSGYDVLRVINWWLDDYRQHRIFGIEVHPNIAQTTRKRLASYPNVTILTGDACQLIPDDGSFFYPCNP
jgi:hypothetical protein